MHIINFKEFYTLLGEETPMLSVPPEAVSSISISLSTVVEANPADKTDLSWFPFTLTRDTVYVHISQTGKKQ